MPKVFEISDFFNVDYTTFFPGDDPVNRFFSFFVPPLVPIVAVTLYWFLSDLIFEGLRDTFKIERKGFFMNTVTNMHSGALAIYSMWTCYNIWAIAFPYIRTHGFYNGLTDESGELWRLTSFWVTHFYISKYYEFIDTWVVLLKGRKPLFLQTYHHAGVILCMWGFIITDNTPCGVVLTCLNSGIHSIMYSYYVLTSLGINPPFKSYLTMAQMVQFIVGVSSTIPFYVYVKSPARNLVMGVLHLYTVILLYLFYQFYKKSYSNKKTAKKE